MEEHLNREVLMRSTDLLFKKLPQVINTISLIPVIVAIAFWDKVEHWIVLSWLSMSLLVVLFRYYLAWQYSRLPATHNQYVLWQRWFVISSLVSGLIWGLAGVFFFDETAGIHMVLLFGAIIGLSAGCVVIASYTFSAYLAFAVPAIGIGALHLLLRKDYDAIALGILLLVLLLIITKAALNQKQDTLQGLRLLFENIDLIEQLKHQKMIAEKADSDKSRFLAAASHDLRQPLHAMQLYLSSVNPKMGLIRQPQVWLGLQRSIASLNGLFNSLLDLSRLDAGMLQPNWRDFSLKTFIEGFVDEYVDLADKKGLVLTFPKTDVLIRSDVVLLETIVRNLVSNAIRYTNTGKIEILWRVVDVGVDAKKVLLTVKDTGIGIAPDYQQEVFNEYFQIDNPERDKNNGLGLGLAIVSRLSLLLDCEISLSSLLGEGTSFYLTIPLGHDADLGELPDVEIPKEKEFLNHLVWIIDDDALVREGMQLLMNKWGCDVVAFTSYDEVLQHWQGIQVVPSLLIADYRLKGHENGAEVLKLLMTLLNVSVPSLIVTGDTSPERLNEAQSHAIPLLHKPINAARLRVFMRQVLMAGDDNTSYLG